MISKKNNKSMEKDYKFGRHLKLYEKGAWMILKKNQSNLVKNTF